MRRLLLCWLLGRHDWQYMTRGRWIGNRIRGCSRCQLVQKSRVEERAGDGQLKEVWDDVRYTA